MNPLTFAVQVLSTQCALHLNIHFMIVLFVFYPPLPSLILLDYCEDHQVLSCWTMYVKSKCMSEEDWDYYTFTNESHHGLALAWKPDVELHWILRWAEMTVLIRNVSSHDLYQPECWIRLYFYILYWLSMRLVLLVVGMWDYIPQ